MSSGCSATMPSRGNCRAFSSTSTRPWPHRSQACDSPSTASRPAADEANSRVNQLSSSSVQSRSPVVALLLWLNN
eukprot:15449000-Alexandrium_andersonii.AAC.1